MLQWSEVIATKKNGDTREPIVELARHHHQLSSTHFGEVRVVRYQESDDDASWVFVSSTVTSESHHDQDTSRSNVDRFWF